MYKAMAELLICEKVRAADMGRSVGVCHGVKQNAKICAIGETECNEI